MCYKKLKSQQNDHYFLDQVILSSCSYSRPEMFMIAVQIATFILARELYSLSHITSFSQTSTVIALSIFMQAAFVCMSMVGHKTRSSLRASVRKLVASSLQVRGPSLGTTVQRMLNIYPEAPGFLSW